MSSMADALGLDLADSPVSTALAYEEVLEKDPSNRDALVNLVGLYFSVLDYGYASAHCLSQDFVERSDERLRRLVDFGLGIAPEDTEFDFWKRYYAVRVLGEGWGKLFPEGYEAVVVNGSSLVPYLALFLSFHGEKYEAQLHRLLAEVSAGKTQRERELKSVAESALRMGYRRSARSRGLVP
jgi:hypothetical protein